MRVVLEVFPGARRTLFRKYHVGGCSSCGFEMEETLGALCARNGDLPVAEVLAVIQTSHAADQQILIEPATLKEWMATQPTLRLLDIRTREEFDAARIASAIHLTRDVMQEAMARWDPDAPVVILDHKGEQSLDAAAYFLGHGLRQVRCLRGGMDAWAREVDPAIPRYELA
ncbi:MAG: rhodanese-like domain-containing protein [Pedosphaera sp.]|nr:rhodanese-like domain-containing protein [Pedosphaera sp.]MSU42828.1 rhodanese-like domain-containing protein [Pedosphaera sp.]